MRVYEATLSYRLVQAGQAEPLSRPEQVANYLRSAFEESPIQEAFWVVLLNRKNRPLARLRISLGTLTSSLVHPREVFRAAMLGSAAAIIVAHNHPSGDPAPSSADVEVTLRLREAAKIVDIELIDHVIVGDAVSDPRGLGYYSFREAGVI